MIGDQSMDLRTTSQVLRQSIREVGVSFLINELGLARTLLDISMTTSDPARRIRNIQNARKVYRTVLRFMPDLGMSKTENLRLTRELAILTDRFTVEGIDL